MRKSKIMPFMLVASVFSLSACTLPKWLSWLSFIPGLDAPTDEKEKSDTPDAEKADEGTGGGWEGNVLTLDFTDGYWKSNVIDAYVTDNTTLITCEFLGVTYEEAGCFINKYEDKKWLAMKNKFNDGDKFVDGQFAYFTNASEYGKTIKSMQIFVADTTGGANIVTSFSSDAAFTGPSTTGNTHQCKSQTAENYTVNASSGAKYWCLSATGTAGTNAKNIAIEKLVITFND